MRFGSPPAPRTPQAPWHGAGSGPPDSGGPSLGQGPSRPPRKPPRAHIALATQPWRPDPRGRSRQLGPPGLSWRGGRQLSELARAISKFAEGGGNPEIAGFTIAPGGGTRWGRGFLRRGAPRLLLSPPPRQLRLLRPPAPDHAAAAAAPRTPARTAVSPPRPGGGRAISQGAPPVRALSLRNPRLLSANRAADSQVGGAENPDPPPGPQTQARGLRPPPAKNPLRPGPTRPQAEASARVSPGPGGGSGMKRARREHIDFKTPVKGARG